jgi:hypothetical protein
MDGTSKEDWLLVLGFVYPLVPQPDITWDNLEVSLPLLLLFCIRLSCSATRVVLHRRHFVTKASLTKLLSSANAN